VIRLKRRVTEPFRGLSAGEGGLIPEAGAVVVAALVTAIPAIRSAPQVVFDSGSYMAPPSPTAERLPLFLSFRQTTLMVLSVLAGSVIAIRGCYLYSARRSPL
jgi:hypothetical protein